MSATREGPNESGKERQTLLKREELRLCLRVAASAIPRPASPRMTPFPPPRLPNNLRAILVSDPTTDKSAAALSVRVGASQDPPEAPGLAHFCEHMVGGWGRKHADGLGADGGVGSVWMSICPCQNEEAIR